MSAYLQAQQKECVDSSQGSHGGIHSNSHSVSGGFSSRVPAFSSPLCHESNDDEDSETSHSEDNQKPLKPSKNKSISGSVTKLAEPLYEEDVIDGFAIISFSTYEDLEVSQIVWHQQVIFRVGPVWFCLSLSGCREDYRENVMFTRSFGTFGYQRKKPL